MLNIRTLPVGDYQTNCYIVWAEGEKWCVVIDPGDAPEIILQATEEAGVKIDSVLLTHGHFDHVGAVRDLAATYGCRVYLRAEEATMPPQMTAGALYFTDEYPVQGQLEVADLQVRVMHTPGHTPGSVCLLMEDAMFSGDTLFAGSMGRCDFPGSNIFDMRKSLRSLCALEKNYRIFPGHGEDSTLDFEKKTNPYLR